jgi:hypothetical protein
MILLSRPNQRLPIELMAGLAQHLDDAILILRGLTWAHARGVSGPALFSLFIGAILI